MENSAVIDPPERITDIVLKYINLKAYFKTVALY
jgi:hypothetical protein